MLVQREGGFVSQAGALAFDGANAKLTITSAAVQNLSGLFTVLPQQSELEALDLLEIDLSQLSVVYPSTVAILCAWFEACPSALTGKTLRIVQPSNESACQWLEKVTFFKFIEHSAPQLSSDAITVALHSIEPGDPNAPNVVVDQVSGLLRRHAASLAADVLHSTQTALAEVVENVTRHAEPASPAFACGQVHPNTHRFSFCVAHAGIGLRESFRRAPYEPARERLEAGDDPLDLAIEPLMSIKYGTGHSGYGLFYASELCSQANGTFIVSSESSSLTLSATGSRVRETHRHWPGTVVKSPSRHDGPDRRWDDLVQAPFGTRRRLGHHVRR